MSNALAKAGKVSIRKVFKDKSLKRLLSFLWQNAKGTIIFTIFAVIITSASSLVNSFYLQQLIQKVIAPSIANKALLKPELNYFINLSVSVGAVLLLGVIANFAYTQLLAVATHKILNKLRINLFKKMERLPISYFDANKRGDIMSRYTNDVDAIQQFISESLVNLLSTALTLVFAVSLMLYYSFYLTLAVILGAVLMFFIGKIVAKKSGKYFYQQQIATGKVEGYIEEGMNGLKVVKVFTHEKESEEEFDKLNDELAKVSTKANICGNVVWPIMGNIGNILYVIVAVLGAFFVLLKVPNLGLCSINPKIGIVALDASIVVAFLTMTKTFTQSITQISSQIAQISLALAGTKRVFDLLDEEDEVDNGYVTMVNVIKKADGTLIETKDRTHVWAWKHPHKDLGTVELKEIKGDIQLHQVDFGYTDDKLVLHDIEIYAHPGQRIALVGATGAGKTTITNLINRFYDIQDGKVRYDGININKIKKQHLRNSLAIVLQETNLFSGTVMENIRYGRLEATDEEVYEAAKIANAYDFISRLPKGFETELTTNGANLSQGQRQLISIARAAIKDAPVMILDEATSSIDTRTEQLVQKGTDELMKGRTVFVIAHRLSTIRNCDAIMVLDHGRIIERGNHESLLAKKGVYYQLYTGKFELE